MQSRVDKNHGFRRGKIAAKNDNLSHTTILIQLAANDATPLFRHYNDSKSILYNAHLYR
jgi:hypothetical protein